MPETIDKLQLIDKMRDQIGVLRDKSSTGILKDQRLGYLMGLADVLDLLFENIYDNSN